MDTNIAYINIGVKATNLAGLPLQDNQIHQTIHSIKDKDYDKILSAIKSAEMDLKSLRRKLKEQFGK